jgi:hypothetical protein
MLTLIRHEPGLEDAGDGERVVYALAVTAPVTDDLRGELSGTGLPGRAINARRCPS